MNKIVLMAAMLVICADVYAVSITAHNNTDKTVDIYCGPNIILGKAITWGTKIGTIPPKMVRGDYGWQPVEQRLDIGPCTNMKNLGFASGTKWLGAINMGKKGKVIESISINSGSGKIRVDYTRVSGGGYNDMDLK
jgi:hypothetical protein